MINIIERGRDFDISVEKFDWESPVSPELFDVHGEPLGGSNTALAEPNPYGTGDVLLIELNKELINPEGITPMKIYATVPEEVSFEDFTEVSPVGLLIIYNGFYNYTIQSAKNELLKSIELNASLHGGSVHVDVYKRNCTDSWPEECSEWNFITSFEFTEDQQEIDFPRYTYGDDELRFDVTISPGDLKELPEIYELNLNTAMINIEPQIFVTQVNDNADLVNGKPTLVRVRAELETDDPEIAEEGIPVVVTYKLSNGDTRSAEFISKNFTLREKAYGKDCAQFYLENNSFGDGITAYANVTLDSGYVFNAKPVTLSAYYNTFPRDDMLDIVFFPVINTGGEINEELLSNTIANGIDFLKGVYPVDPTRVNESPGSAIDYSQLLKRKVFYPGYLRPGRKWEIPIYRIQKEAERRCIVLSTHGRYIDRCVAVLPPDGFAELTSRALEGLAILPVIGFFGTRAVTIESCLQGSECIGLAHELAHSYGMTRERYDEPATSGWWVERHEPRLITFTRRGIAYKVFYAYMNTVENTKLPHWSHIEDYNWLMRKLTTKFG